MQKATKVLLLLAGGAVMASTVLNSCKSKDTPLPAIGGYNSSNDIASTNLLAHWTFDGTMNESKSGTAPTTSTGITYGSGVATGQSATFSNGYAVYPTIAAMSGSSVFQNGFTISSWIKVANNGTTATNLFALTQAQSVQPDWNQGPINYYVETNQFPSGHDTLHLHTAFHSFPNGVSTGGDNINAYGVENSDTGYYDVVYPPTTWIHYVAVYDASTSNIDLYANGKVVSNFQFRHRTTASGGIGQLVFPSPTQSIIGGFPNANTGYTKSAVATFEGLFTGSMDELRVYNKPLSSSDISSLYQLEMAGR